MVVEVKSYVERGRDGIVYRSPRDYQIPQVDLLTLLFEHEACRSGEETLLHVDAANPSLSITKAQARTYTKRLAYALRHKYGVGRDGPDKDIVTLISSGNYYLPIVFYGIIAAGGVCSSASAASTLSDLARVLQGGPSGLLVCSEDTKDIALAAAKQIGLPLDRVLVVDAGASPGLRTVMGGREVASREEMDWKRITSQKELDNSVICLLYSSGTTGLPKGVCISHTNIVAECATTVDLWMERAAVLKPDFEMRTIGHLPTAHIAGMQCYFVNPVYQGGPVYWMPKFDFTMFLEYVKKYRITYFFTVPPIYLLIAKSPLVTDQFETMVAAVTGAAPMGKDLQLAASKKLGMGGTLISQTWGLSETTGSVTMMPYGYDDDTGSVSMLLPNMRARMVDDKGKDVEPGAPGELWIKGPVIANGYHNNPKANAESFTDGWFRTGDIGEFRNGLFYIVDRKKELIKYKGLQVAPAELEAHLISHPLILDAAVIGVEAEGTEVPRAYVVADQSKISGSDVEKFVKDNLTSHKWLRGGVVFLEAIPKSPSGKILRKDLREMAKKEVRAKL